MKIYFGKDTSKEFLLHLLFPVSSTIARIEASFALISFPFKPDRVPHNGKIDDSNYHQTLKPRINSKLSCHDLLPEDLPFSSKSPTSFSM